MTWQTIRPITPPTQSSMSTTGRPSPSKNCRAQRRCRGRSSTAPPVGEREEAAAAARLPQRLGVEQPHARAGRRRSSPSQSIGELRHRGACPLSPLGRGDCPHSHAARRQRGVADDERRARVAGRAAAGRRGGSGRRRRRRTSRGRSCGRSGPRRPSARSAARGASAARRSPARRTTSMTSKPVSMPTRSCSSNGPMRKPRGAHDAVDRLDVGDAAPAAAQRLQPERPVAAVHDEARAVRGSR